MSVAFIADIHAANHRRHGGPVKAGINRRCQHVLDALQHAVTLADRQGCEALVILGDLFDTTNPPQQIVTQVQRILEGTSLHTYVLLGNHDMVSTAPGDHALGPLAPCVNEVVTVPQVVNIGKQQLVFVPFQPGPAVEWLPAVLKEWLGTKPAYDISDNAALLIHLGIAGDNTPVFLRGAHDAVPSGLLVGLCKEYGFKAVFAGNWHSHKVLRKRPMVCQVGALAPTGYDNPGLDGVGTMVVWHGGTKIDAHTIPGPRFIKLRAGETWDASKTEGCSVYLEITADAKSTGAALGALATAKLDGLVVGGEVVPDTAEVREAARKAATVARSAGTLDEALHAYIEHMALPDGVDRADVLALAKKYLGDALS